MDGWINKWMDGWMDESFEWMDKNEKWVDGWMIE